VFRDLTPWNFLAWAVVLFIAATLIVLFRAIVDDFADRRRARKAHAEAVARLAEELKAEREQIAKNIMAGLSRKVAAGDSTAAALTEKPPDA
jgi:signal transduction histidine kinase